MNTMDSVNAIVTSCCCLGIVYSLICAWLIVRVKVQSRNDSEEANYTVFDESDEQNKISSLLEIGHHIETGANAFLYAEYKYISVFIIIISIVIFCTVETQWGQFWSTVAFITGALTSLASGYIGMRVATFSNYRCAYQAQTSMTKAFQVAFSAGCVMGFSLTSLGVLVLQVLIAVYTNWYVQSFKDIPHLFEKVSAYGLGGSTMALFGRVGGGIYTKAADVGADLVGKVEEHFAEDSPQNPATIADNVGDNVGDIAGMGSDLFGSFAESTCACLVISSVSPAFYLNSAYIYFPLLIVSISIPACLLASLLAVFGVNKAESFEGVQNTLKIQLIVSSVLIIAVFALVSFTLLPARLTDFVKQERQPVHAFLCLLVGLLCGLIVGFVTEYYTSHSYRPVQEVAESCQTGAATNIIYGMALGHQSTIIPVVLLVITAFLSQMWLGMFGVSLAAIGMLSNLPIALAIDAYGPVSDNAGGIAEMCNLGEQVRDRTDALDAAGNTTAAIGKGFAIGSAALVSLALFGAFITKSTDPSFKHPIQNVDVISPLVFAGLFFGAMLPYAFSALTMKSVGTAAKEMVEEIRNQLKDNPGIRTGEVKPDFQRCIKISTDASLKEMILPGILVIVTPFVVGMCFGTSAVAGLLPGALISGVAMGLSSTNSGGAWDNAKKYIEAGNLYVQGVVKKKYSKEHEAAVIGDTVGDPLKDTSGPALNILIKLMAILSLVYAKFFDNTAFFQCSLDSSTLGC